MADQRRRELERLAVQGDGEATTRLLLDRMRAGEEVGEGQLRVLAGLGDPLAQESLQGEPKQLNGLRMLVRALREEGKRPLIQAALAAAEAVRSQWKELNSEDPRLAEMIDLARAWLADPESNEARRSRPRPRVDHRRRPAPYKRRGGVFNFPTRVGSRFVDWREHRAVQERSRFLTPSLYDLVRDVPSEWTWRGAENVVQGARYFATAHYLTERAKDSWWIKAKAIEDPRLLRAICEALRGWAISS